MTGNDQRVVRLLALLLLVELFLGIHVLVAVWPEVAKVTVVAEQSAAPQSGGQPPELTAEFSPVTILGLRWRNPSPDGLYLVAVIVIGGIGSLVHVLTSLASYAGNRTFRSSWTWWYIIRLPIGASIAALLYFVVRGGLLSAGTSAGSISPYGVGALAGLSGMFSKQAIDKLEEVFSTLFRTQKGGDAERKDKVAETDLSIDELLPPRVSVGTTQLVVRMAGTGFTPGMTVTVGGERRALEVVSPNECVVTLLPPDVERPGVLDVVATADAPGQEASTAQLRIEENS